MSATFYTIADARYFVGIAALLNSLRLTGHHEQLVVIDAGLTASQQELLEPHVDIAIPPNRDLVHPFLLKGFPHHVQTSGVVALIDCDIIVTGSFADILGRAAEGKFCLYNDHPDSADRYFAEWEGMFSLAAPPRRRGYLHAGFFALSVDVWPEFLPRWEQACEQIPEDAIRSGHDNPVENADQDALNAILSAEYPETAIEALPVEEIAFYDTLTEIRVVDPRTLTCVRDGRRMRMLHYSYSPKPWQRRAWLRAREDVFVQLLPRLLFAADVELRLSPELAPPWLRPDRGGELLRRGLRANNILAAGVHHLPTPARRTLRRLRNRLTDAA